MVVVIRFDVGDLNRRAINNLTGTPGLATRKEIEQWIRMTVRATLESIGMDDDFDAALQESGLTVGKKRRTKAVR